MIQSLKRVLKNIFAMLLLSDKNMLNLNFLLEADNNNEWKLQLLKINGYLYKDRRYFRVDFVSTRFPILLQDFLKRKLH